MTWLIRGKAQGFHDAGWSLSKTGKHLVATKGAVKGSVQKDLQSLGLETSLQSNQNLAKRSKIDATAVIKNNGYLTKQ